VATFTVTENKPTKIEAKILLELDTDEIQFLAIAARYYSNAPAYRNLVTQLENALNQAKEMERG
jgi:hypothetical protein